MRNERDEYFYLVYRYIAMAYDIIYYAQMIKGDDGPIYLAAQTCKLIALVSWTG